MRRSAIRGILSALPILVGGCNQDASVPTEPVQPQFALARTKRLRVDQSNTVSDGLGLSNGLYGQTFVPTTSNLAQVDLLLIVNQVPVGGVFTTVGLYADITQAPIDTTIAFVDAPAPGEVTRTIHYIFDPPVPLTKRQTYTIGWRGGTETSWVFAFGDHYLSGQAVMSDGSPVNPTADFVFTTYTLR
jgi:hypothetical protein